MYKGTTGIRKEVRQVEKVIGEWRLVETDDGFRLEVKGDKEALRKRFGRKRSGRPLRMVRLMRFAPWRARCYHSFGPGWERASTAEATEQD